MPNRRVFELIIVTGILVKPAFGLINLWARKHLATSSSGTLIHGAAEVAVILT